MESEEFWAQGHQAQLWEEVGGSTENREIKKKVTNPQPLPPPFPPNSKKLLTENPGSQTLTHPLETDLAAVNAQHEAGRAKQGTPGALIS